VLQEEHHLIDHSALPLTPPSCARRPRPEASPSGSAPARSDGQRGRRVVDPRLPVLAAGQERGGAQVATSSSVRSTRPPPGTPPPWRVAGAAVAGRNPWRRSRVGAGPRGGRAPTRCALPPAPGNHPLRHRQRSRRRPRGLRRRRSFGSRPCSSSPRSRATSSSSAGCGLTRGSRRRVHPVSSRTNGLTQRRRAAENDLSPRLCGSA
jgi:hypothetical protein